MSDTTRLLVYAREMDQAYCSVGVLNHTDIVLGIVEDEPYNQAMDLLQID